jgi:predicted transposase YbfD/YdcC
MDSKLKQQKCEVASLETVIDTQRFLNSVQLFFQDVPDPRSKKNCKYSFSLLLFLMLLAVFSGANTIEGIHDYTVYKLEFLRELFGDKFTSPSYSTFWWILTRMNPEAFAEAFAKWTRDCCLSNLAGKQLSLDGKSLRSALDANGNCNTHIVHAWLHEQGLLIGQKKTDEKSNEITAIPALLSQIDINGATVTIDAAGCQKNIVEIIRRQGGDYLLAVKNNQPTLYREIVTLFEDARKDDFDYVLNCDIHEQIEKKSGRIEKRSVTIISDPSEISVADQWKDLETLVEVINETTSSKGKITKETRYYIASLVESAEQIGARARAHWGIESMHWSLDVTFREDESRANVLHGAVNFGTLRRACMNMVKSDPGLKKLGFAKARRLAMWGPDDAIIKKVIDSLFGVKSF